MFSINIEKVEMALEKSIFGTEVVGCFNIWILLEPIQIVLENTGSNF